MKMAPKGSVTIRRCCLVGVGVVLEEVCPCGGSPCGFIHAEAMSFACKM